jgi:hypothetical protein
MQITDVDLQRTSGADEISADIGGFRLWYRITPGGVLAPSADAFLAAALLPAMVRGEPLELAGATASPRLLRGLDQIQVVFATWRRELQPVAVVAAEAPPLAPRPGVVSFFSGGVDSLHTFLERQDEITHAVQIHGFEYRRQNRALAEEAEHANRRFVEGRQRQLVVVESNFREFYEGHRIHSHLYHGGVLASIALTLGFARAYVPASDTWDGLSPWGSHPVTDPLWGTESVEIVHHGVDARRVDKLRRLGREQDALELLRVCPANTVYSCGSCEKCVRTRVLMRVLGIRSPRLPDLGDLAPVRRLRVTDGGTRFVWQQNLEAAVEAGDRALARAISLAIARYDVRRAALSLERALLGGRLLRAKRALRRALGRPVGETPELGPVRADVELPAGTPAGAAKPS